MSHPPHAEGNRHAPRLIAWELTRSCNLNCRHCRAAATTGPYPDELTLDEIKRVLDNVAAHFNPIMILTGGEPMLRPDLLDIVRHTKGLGLRPVLATCGTLLTEDSARSLKDAGIARISVSIDGPDAESHDSFRGVPGAFDASMKGLDAARAAGLPFQVNTTITRLNMEHLEAILDLTVSLGAVAFHPFLLVPTGRGDTLREQLLDAEEYERILHRIYDLRQDAPIPFKPTCAPHYYRI
ncbi:MAG: radical SAM protein, partial [Candidatus Hydrogenedentes bacterium]|nr:radical SAM protein [Candidatus Hydrogenedentota bacterium]